MARTTTITAHHSPGEPGRPEQVDKLGHTHSMEHTDTSVRTV